MSSFSKDYKTGDVISVAFFPHQEDKTQGEPRWLICLEDYGNDIYAVPLKSNLSHQKHHKDSFVIKKDSNEGKLMKLKNDSLVVTDRAQRIKKVRAIIHGECTKNLMERLQNLIPRQGNNS